MRLMQKRNDNKTFKTFSQTDIIQIETGDKDDQSACMESAT